MKRLNSVLFVIDNLSGGGAERVLAILANNFAALGIVTSVGMLQSHGKPMEYDLTGGVAVVDFSRNTAKGRRGVLRALFRLRRFVKTQKPDVVIPFMLHNAVMTLGACLGLRCPAVIRFAIMQKRWKTLFTRIAGPMLLPKARGAVYQTEEQKAFFRKHMRNEGVILPNPVETRPSWDEPRSYEGKTVIAAGRLSGQKNFSLLIRAFSALEKSFPDWRLIIYGEGIARDDLQYEVENLGLTSKISLPGFSKDIHEVMHRAPVFVMSSLYEGMPNALIEALCAGCACVTTNFDGGATSILVRDGDNGLVVPNDDTDAMADALRRLMLSEDLRRTLGQSAARLREKFNARKIALQWVDYLESVISI